MGEEVTKFLENDLKNQREKCKYVNALKGLDPNAPVSCSADTRYNSNTIGSSYKYGQNASQAITIVTENQTDLHEVVACEVTNKLCWRGSNKRNNGEPVVCPGGHPKCTANLARHTPISERKIGINLGESFATEQFLVKYLTTDGDGKIGEGMDTGYKSKLASMALEKETEDELIKLWDVIRHSDYIHLGASQFKKCHNTKFSDQVFNGGTVEERNLQQHLLSLDVKSRCHLIINELHKKYKGDISKIKEKLHSVIEATLNCYAGNHKKCRVNSLVCGGGTTNNWFRKSKFLSARFAQKKYFLSTNDSNLLYNILIIRLGASPIDKTKFRTHTNKDESMNRAMSVSNPKNVNFSRNVKPRALSSVFRVKEGTGTANLKKLTFLHADPAPTGRVGHCLKELDKFDQYNKTYKLRESVRRRRVQQKINDYNNHFGGKTDCDYSKGQLDHAPRQHRVIRRNANDRSDHSYSLLPINNQTDD